jgi:hypothetical protein
MCSNILQGENQRAQFRKKPHKITRFDLKRIRSYEQGDRWESKYVVRSATQNKVDFGSWWCCVDEIPLTHEWLAPGPVGVWGTMSPTPPHRNLRVMCSFTNCAVSTAICQTIAFHHHLSLLHRHFPRLQSRVRANLCHFLQIIALWSRSVVPHLIPGEIHRYSVKGKVVPVLN